MRALSVVLLLSLLPPAAAAQLIQVKTVPVAAGDQFLIIPSRSLGMGGLSIALDDPLADPFVNPAKGARLTGNSLLAAPAFYSISQNAGNAGTLPLGVLLASGDRQWFGGGVLAFQQLSPGDRFTGIPPQRGARPLSEGSGNNLYGTALLGRRLGDDLAVGMAAFVADLAALDGVDLLYPGSLGLSQSGNVIDLRVGLSGAAPAGGTFEVLAVHNRVNMTHEVTYQTGWGLDRTGTIAIPLTRLETNLDQTNTWGLHGGYVHPLSGTTSVGGALTVNRKSHPKIPNYELMNIPRDPGTTWAYGLGVGIARTAGNATFGADVIVQPIRTHTWAEAAMPELAADGSIIPAGGPTVDNRFRFTNATIRLGLEQREEPASFTLGLELHSINYSLRQNDLVAQTTRVQRENWIEWTPTVGASVAFDEFTLRYVGRLTTGTGQPGIALGFGRQDTATTLAGGDFLPAPAGALTLNDAVVLSHQLSVVMPLR